MSTPAASRSVAARAAKRGPSRGEPTATGAQRKSARGSSGAVAAAGAENINHNASAPSEREEDLDAAFAEEDDEAAALLQQESARQQEASLAGSVLFANADALVGNFRKGVSALAAKTEAFASDILVWSLQNVEHHATGYLQQQAADIVEREHRIIQFQSQWEAASRRIAMARRPFFT